MEAVLLESGESLHGQRLSVTLNGHLVNVSALARVLDTNQSNLSKFLSGHRSSSADYARRVAKALGISTDALLDAIDSRKLQKLA